MHTALKLIACSTGLALAASVTAGPSPTYFATAHTNRESAAPTAATAGMPATPVPAANSEVYHVMRGSPKSPFSGLTYVDASGRELSRVRDLAMQKAAGGALAALAKADKETVARSGN